MMKRRKLSTSILSTAVVLALLVSVVSGLGIGASAANAASSTWTYDYAVTCNTDTSSVNYYNAANLGGIVNDFKVYAYARTDGTYTESTSDPNWQGGVPVSGTTTRQNAKSDSDYRNAGYLSLQWANDSREVALTHNTALTKNDEFLLEMDILVSVAWSNSAGIMIAPAGQFALSNNGNTDATAADAPDKDKGVYIDVLRGGAGIAGTVDSSTAKTLSTSNISANITTDAQGGIFNNPPVKYETSKAGYGYLYTWTADSSLLSVKENEGNMIVTYCVQVKDGVISVWEKNTPAKVLAVALSDKYAGGNISFVSNSQLYNAFVGMRMKKLVKQTSWSYAVQRNTTSADYTNAQLADLAADFKVYSFNQTDRYKTVSLKSGYPKAVDTTTVTVAPAYATADSDTNEAARNFGYLDFKTSGIMAMTHNETLKATDEFRAEMDFVIYSGTWSAAQGLMIAPAGQFALSNDGNADNDHGIFISYDVNNWSVAGAIDAEQTVTTDDRVLTEWSADPFGTASQKCTYFVWNSAANDLKTTVTETNQDPKEYTARIKTLCIEVRNGVLSLWDKAVPSNVLSVALSDAYTGGCISFVSTTFWNDAFAGMRLWKYETMKNGEVAVNPDTGIITVKPEQGKEIQNGSLVVTAGSASYVPTRVGFRSKNHPHAPLLYRVLDASGKVVTGFTAQNVSVSFTANSLETPNIANYAVSINTEKSGLRFISRFNFEKDASGTMWFTAADGTRYEITDYGMLMAAKQSLQENEELTVGSENSYIKKLSVKERNVYYDLSDSFADMAVTVTGIGTEYLDLMISARPYVTVKVGTSTQVLYGSCTTTSYAVVAG